MAGMLGALGGMFGAAGGASTGAAAGAASGASGMAGAAGPGMKGLMGMAGGATGAGSPGITSGAEPPAAIPAQAPMPTSVNPGAGNPDGPIGSNFRPLDSMGTPLKQPVPQMSTMDRIAAYYKDPVTQARLAQSNQQQIRDREAMMYGR